MICPNCQMNIKNGSTFCIHCGANFDITPTSNQPVINQDNIPTQNTTDDDKYLKAYFGTRYDDVINNKFSWGTFFLGPIWPLCHKLFKMAAIMYIIQQIAMTITLFLSFIIIATTVKTPDKDMNGLEALDSLIYIVYAFIAVVVVLFIVSFIFSKKFSDFYLEKAHKNINSILNKTNSEEERLNLCRKRGKPLYLLLVIILIYFVLLRGYSHLGIDSIINKNNNPPVNETEEYNSSNFGTFGTIENSRRDSMAETIKTSTNAIRDAINVNGLSCTVSGAGIDAASAPNGTYYVPITEIKDLIEKRPLSPWGSKDLQGYIKWNKVNNQMTYYADVTDGDGHGTNGEILVDSLGRESIYTKGVIAKSTPSTGYICKAKYN